MFFGGYDHDLQHTLDTSLLQGMFDCLIGESIGSERVEVFFDRHRLQDGQDFRESFMTAVAHSLGALPLVSADALQRMLTMTDPLCLDNVLLEWTLIRALYHAKVDSSCCPS